MADRVPQKYAIWDGKTDLITPSGERFTPEEWIEKNVPWWGMPGAYTVVSAGIRNGADIHELSVLANFTNNLCEQMEIDPTDHGPIKVEDYDDPVECLLAIEDAEKKMQDEQRLATSAEDRIAAAMEAEAMERELAEVEETPSALERIAAVMEAQQMDAELAQLEA